MATTTQDRYAIAGNDPDYTIIDTQDNDRAVAILAYLSDAYGIATQLNSGYWSLNFGGSELYAPYRDKFNILRTHDSEHIRSFYVGYENGVPCR